MVVFIRRVGEVADGSVTSIKLAAGAVDLNSDAVVGELPNAKLANGAVTEAKLDDLAVSTGKLKANAVTLAKTTDALRIHHLVGDETEVSITGTDEVIVKEFSYPKTAASKGCNSAKIHVVAEVKTSNALNVGSLFVYIDDEAAPRITLSTSSETYEIATATADVTDLLVDKKHRVRVALASDSAVESVWNNLFEFFIEKEAVE